MTQSNATLAPAAGLPRTKQDDIDDVELKTDTRPPIRLGLWILVVGFGLFIAWAAWAPLDEGVATQATVSVESRRKTIQHMQGGVIREVLVKEGSEVRAGDVLVILDDAATRASFESIRQNYLAQRAHESRLQAELAQAASITFHPDLLQPSDSVAAQLTQVQRQLFAAKRATQEAEVAAARQAIAGLEVQVNGVRQMLENRRTQQALQARQLASVKSLAEDGFAPRNQALQLEQTQAELTSSIADLESTRERAMSAIAETRLKITQRQQEYLKEASTQLADVRKEVQANQDRLVAITSELARTQIRTPVAGQVIGMVVSGVGGVVTPGQRLMDVLPRGESLLLDAKIPPNVIDRIKVGDAVEVRFTAFANSPQLVVHGKLVSLAGDALTETSGPTTHSFYLARVELTAQGLKALGDKVVQPGMMAEVLVKTGERSLMTYLLHPLLKRVAASMTEE